MSVFVGPPSTLAAKGAALRESNDRNEVDERNRHYRQPCTYCRWPDMEGEPTGRRLRVMRPRDRQVLDELRAGDTWRAHAYLETVLATLPPCRPCRGNGYLGESYVLGLYRDGMEKAQAEARQARKAENAALAELADLEAEFADVQQGGQDYREIKDCLERLEGMVLDHDRGVVALDELLTFIADRAWYGSDVVLVSRADQLQHKVTQSTRE